MTGLFRGDFGCNHISLEFIPQPSLPKVGVAYKIGRVNYYMFSQLFPSRNHATKGKPIISADFRVWCQRIYNWHDNHNGKRSSRWQHMGLTCATVHFGICQWVNHGLALINVEGISELFISNFLNTRNQKL